MKHTIVVVTVVMLMAFILTFTSGCGMVGANVRLEGLSLGTVAMDGKPLNGLPSDKINLELDVSAQTVKVQTNADGTVITLVPSGGTVVIKGDSISFSGLKPDQVKVEWATKPAQ